MLSICCAFKAGRKQFVHNELSNDQRHGASSAGQVNRPNKRLPLNLLELTENVTQKAY